MSKFEDNKDCVAMLHNMQGSLENRFREAYNKGYKDGLRDGATQVTARLVSKILEEGEQTMSDLIRREDAIKIMACEMYAEAQSQGYDVDGIEDFMPEAKAWITDAPSIEIVRCKECKYRETCEKIIWFDIGKYKAIGSEIDSCSYGERREK